MQLTLCSLHQNLFNRFNKYCQLSMRRLLDCAQGEIPSKLMAVNQDTKSTCIGREGGWGQRKLSNEMKYRCIQVNSYANSIDILKPHRHILFYFDSATELI